MMRFSIYIITLIAALSIAGSSHATATANSVKPPVSGPGSTNNTINQQPYVVPKQWPVPIVISTPNQYYAFGDSAGMSAGPNTVYIPLWLRETVSKATSFSYSIPASEAHVKFNAKSFDAWVNKQGAILARMLADKDPSMTNIVKNAQNNKYYGNFGQMAVVAYMATKDPKYAQTAYTEFTKVLATTPSANQIREDFVELALGSKIISKTLPVWQQKRLAAGLMNWCNYSLGINQAKYRGGYRVSDTDHTTGQYFGSLLTTIGFKDIEPATARCAHGISQAPHNPNYKIGGAIPGDEPGVVTVRDMIKRYITFMARGGEWMESSEYNYGTPRILLMGVRGARAMTGDETLFPEYDAFKVEFAKNLVHRTTTDLAKIDIITWGDDERPTSVPEKSHLSMVTTMAMMAQGEIKTDPFGPPFKAWIDELLAKNGKYGYKTAGPWGTRWAYFYDPYVKTAPWRTSWYVKKGYRAESQGFTYYHDNWNDVNGSFFFSHTPRRLGVDHEVPYTSNFGLFRKGERVIGNPVGYGGTTYYMRENTINIMGYSGMYNKAPLASQVVDGKYVFTATRTWGLPFDQTKYYDPPPVFVKDARVASLYLPSANKQSDVVLQLALAQARNPSKLAKYDRYYAANKAVFGSARGIKEMYLHMLGYPTVSGANKVSYKTKKGQSVVTNVLLPKAFSIRMVSQRDYEPWKSDRGLPESQKQYAIATGDRSGHEFSAFLNVIAVTDSASVNVQVSTLFEHAGFTYVLIKRPGEIDTIVKIQTGKFASATAIREDTASNILSDYKAYLISRKAVSTGNLSKIKLPNTSTPRVFVLML